MRLGEAAIATGNRSNTSLPAGFLQLPLVVTTRVPAAPLAGVRVTASAPVLPLGLGVIVGTGVGPVLSPLKVPVVPLQPFKPLIGPVAEPSAASVRVPNKVRVAAPRAPLPLGVALGFEEGEELGLLDGDELGLPEGDELGLPDELGLLEGEELPLLDGAGNAFDCARTISELPP